MVALAPAPRLTVREFSRRVDRSGVVWVDPESVEYSRGDDLGLTSARRGTCRLPSSFPSKMRDSLFRALPRVREWLARVREPLDRPPKELMKTRVGRVGGSIKVIFLATWISAFSTEKIEDGEEERDLLLWVGGVFGET